ncbi:MAG TPA: hypothetical protein VFK84_17760 [Burkholderiales bacterium]|nr:hypothetical protein [Burkholderiales bacterium]
MEKDERGLRTTVTAVYALQVAGFFLGGIPWLIGVIVNYVKKDSGGACCGA